MDEILVFFQAHGLWLTLIAVVGIIVLGVLKYCGAFKKLEEPYRHACYLAISIGLSVIGSVIYLVCVHQLNWEYVLTLTGTIFALNQSAYAIYSTTSLKELFNKLIDWIKGYFANRKSKKDSSKEDK